MVSKKKCVPDSDRCSCESGNKQDCSKCREKQGDLLVTLWYIGYANLIVAFVGVLWQIAWLTIVFFALFLVFVVGSVAFVTLADILEGIMSD